jgi:1,4-dihydroxy-2-naphthoyl-CoA hydrolase
MSAPPSSSVITSAFGQWLGLKITSATSTLLEAQLIVRHDFGNPAGNLHGGVIMAIGDVLGGTMANFHLPPGTGSATIESKTNFFGSVKLGETVHAACTPLHVGRSTIVLETKVFRRDGKLAASVTQTQLVMAR